jgi:hypothetical protein
VINRRAVQLGLALVVGIFCAVHTYGYYENYRNRSDYLFWDPAAHAYYGVKIAADLSQFRLWRLLKDTNEQVLWPPLHSYVQVPFQLLCGLNFHASSLCSFAFFAMFFVAVSYLYQQFETSWAGWSLLMSLAATSPYYAGYGSMPMLEIFGATFTAFSAALYLKKSRWFPLSLTLLFFLKYNYCIYILLPVVLRMLIYYSKEYSIRISSFRPLLTPFRLFVTLYLLFLLGIMLTGGFEIGKLSVRGIGNPLYVLLWILVIRSLLRKQYTKLWSRIRGTGWEWFFFPVLVWLLVPVPNRVRTLISFAVSAPLGGYSVSDVSYYTYYLKAFSVYFSNNWIALLSVGGAALTWMIQPKREKMHYLALLFALPFLLMTLNQNKQERYLFTFVFSIWVLWSCGVARIKLIWLRYIVAALLSAFVIYSYDPSKVAAVVGWPFVPVQIEGPVQFVVKHVEGANEIRILGTTNQLNPALLAYHVRKASNFQFDPHFGWDLLPKPRAGAYIVSINTEASGRLIAAKRFDDVLVQIRVYLP